VRQGIELLLGQQSLHQPMHSAINSSFSLLEIHQGGDGWLKCTMIVRTEDEDYKSHSYGSEKVKQHVHCQPYDKRRTPSVLDKVQCTSKAGGRQRVRCLPVMPGEYPGGESVSWGLGSGD
jgi:hypothetical protein